jgi:hypothetical protein
LHYYRVLFVHKRVRAGKLQQRKPDRNGISLPNNRLALLLLGCFLPSEASITAQHVSVLGSPRHLQKTDASLPRRTAKTLEREHQEQASRRQESD